MDMIMELLNLAFKSPIVLMVMWAVITDTVFGCTRALKQRAFNSSFGIDGAIRKVSMLASIAFLLVLDAMSHLNLIGFVPEAIRTYIHLERVGVAEFFGLLYLAYEVVSILKNMTMCGLPVKGVWKQVRSALAKYTDELPDND